MPAAIGTERGFSRSHTVSVSLTPDYSRAQQNMKLNAPITLVFVTLSNALAFRIHTVPRNCTEVYSVIRQRYVPYEERYRTKNWLGIVKIKTRVNYKLENHTGYETRRICCSGYEEAGVNECKPVCSKHCGPNSDCVRPEVCECYEGYYRDPNVNECRPVCLNECLNGECSAPNTCACNEGYRMLPDLHSCAPICQGCSNLEYCVEPHVCRCINGYSRASLDRLDSAPEVKCQAICDRDCLNADCVEPNLCRCWPGYVKLADDDFTCEPHCSNGCHNGNCTGPDLCSCLPGYRNSQDQAHVCEPVCTEACVHADCISPETCSCHDGYEPVESEWSHVCQPYCSGTCSHGRCTDPEVCSCDAGYSSINNGTNCQPICSEPCVMGSCTGPETCTCYEGYKLAEGSSFSCEPICEACVNGVCVAPESCSCNDGYEKRDNNVTESQCYPICYCDNGYCNDTSSSCESCAPGYELVTPDNSVAATCEPRCEAECGGHGRCVEPQRCECDENYVADSDEEGNPICVLGCSGLCQHGVCLLANNTCSCAYGWAGDYCQQPILCSINIANNDPLRLINESVYYTEENVDEEPWLGPRCNDRCLEETNLTRCVSDHDGQVHNLTCFIDFDAACNAYVAVESDAYRAKASYTTIVTLTTITLVLALTTVGATVFIKKIHRNKSMGKRN